MFASKTTKEITVGELRVTLQKLSRRVLDEASDAQRVKVAKMFRDAGPSFTAALQAENSRRTKKVEAVPTLEERRNARYASYDPDVVLRKGIRTWSSPTKISEGVEDLDFETSELLFHELIDMSLPALEPKAEEETSKNDSGHSIEP